MTDVDFGKWFADCPDVKVDPHIFPANRTVSLIYCVNLCDLQQINETVLPALYRASPELDMRTLPFQMLPYTAPVTATAFAREIFAGMLIVVIGDVQQIYMVPLSKSPNRNIEESAIDISIYGPRDGFVEDYGMNLALIRKRFRSQSLAVEEYLVGKRSATKVGLLYVQDIVNPSFVQKVRSRLSAIDIDSLISAAQLQDLLGGRRFSFFPLFIFSGRPDFAVDCLSRGRFLLLVEGSPLVIIAPANLFLVLKTPEDSHFPFWITSVSRVLRIFGLLISILLPGFWIALTQYNQDQLPFPLLATITQTRIGLPFPASMELFLMLFLLDLFREAGSRLPRSISQTLTVVGGIVIGDAAIRAALISPSLLIVAALSSVANYTLSNQALAGAVSMLRIAIFLASSILGMYGFVLSVIVLIQHLAAQQSFGLPYLTPISPLSVRDAVYGIVAKNWRLLRRRPDFLDTLDSTKEDGRR
ncbi:spore germination protein [Brevibacillus fluminis]|uniref:Spore germination protein n=1 Tax=Brevibacillus fluminis TaxID=511487 RepID=A0A3M8DNV8_9BACL|nr:spore germination protein [Brevibacillus fluminis]RNB89786.1 spore germination protein [Brevibacillus fluminis]